MSSDSDVEVLCRCGREHKLLFRDGELTFCACGSVLQTVIVGESAKYLAFKFLSGREVALWAKAIRELFGKN